MDHTIKFQDAPGEHGVYDVEVNGNPYGHVVKYDDTWSYWVQLGSPYEEAWQLVGEGPTRLTAVRDGLSNPRRISNV